VLYVAIFMELITATLNVLFVIVSPGSDIPYIEFVVVGYPRIVLFFICSVLTNRDRWWKEYIKVDHPFGGYVTSCVGYVFLIYGTRPIKDANPFYGWRLHAAILFPFLYFALVGNLRTLSKWYPWTRRTIYAYKLVRIYHLIFFTFNQVLGQFVSNQLQPTTVAYFGTVLYMLRELLGHVVRREVALKEHFKKQDPVRGLALLQREQQAHTHDSERRPLLLPP